MQKPSYGSCTRETSQQTAALSTQLLLLPSSTKTNNHPGALYAPIKTSREREREREIERDTDEDERESKDAWLQPLQKNLSQKPTGYDMGLGWKKAHWGRQGQIAAQTNNYVPVFLFFLQCELRGDMPFPAPWLYSVVTTPSELLFTCNTQMRDERCVLLLFVYWFWSVSTCQDPSDMLKPVYQASLHTVRLQWTVHNYRVALWSLWISLITHL